MKFVIKASDGSYKRYPGDSLSSRYDDAGYTTYYIDHADQYDSYEDAKWHMNTDGKFSPSGGAEVMGLELTTVEVVEKEVDCLKCENGTVYIWSPGTYSRDEPCPHCGGTKKVKRVVRKKKLGRVR